MAVQEVDFRNLRRMKAFAAESGGTFTESQLQYLRFNQDRNGFADAFITIGRRVFIDVPKFNQALAMQSKRG